MIKYLITGILVFGARTPMARAQDYASHFAAQAYYNTFASYETGNRRAGREQASEFTLGLDRLALRVIGDTELAGLDLFMALQANPLAPEAQAQCLADAGHDPDKERFCRNSLVEVAKIGVIAGNLQWEMGRDAIQQTAFEGADASYDPLYLSPYVHYFLPFSLFQTALTVRYSQEGLAQQWSLQITDDVTTEGDSHGEFNHRRSQPAVLGQWLGTFVGADLLVQAATFDLNHSYFMTAGFRRKAAATSVSGDVSFQRRAHKPLGQGPYAEDIKAVNISLAQGLWLWDTAVRAQLGYVTTSDQVRAARALLTMEFPWRPSLLQMYTGWLGENTHGLRLDGQGREKGDYRSSSFLIGMKGQFSSL